MKMFVLVIGVSVGAVLTAVPVHSAHSRSRSLSSFAQKTQGFSHEGLQAIQSMLDSAVRVRRIPSAIAMLARGDRIVWLGTSGEMGPGIPMRRDAILPLSSVGKIHTATAAMILYERGVISLDDPVDKFIPEFARVGIEENDSAGRTQLVPPEGAITVRHLLTHSSGLRVTGDSFWTAWSANAERTTTTHLARDLAALPLLSQPGSTFLYGHTGAAYEVLGAVIEIASGLTLEAFMQENIFDPLGLADTYFFLPVDKATRLPAFFRRVGGRLVPDRPYGEEFPRNTFFHGGGGVESSPQDLLRFAQLFLNGGMVDGVRLLRPETVDMMMSDQLGDRARPIGGRTWGFGSALRFSTDESGIRALEQFGWVGGGSVKFWVDPCERLVAYLAFPLAPPGDDSLLDEFERRVYEAMTPPR